MAAEPERCPCLVPVTADHLWIFPVSAYCRGAEGRIRVPGTETLARVCTTPDYQACQGYRASVS